MFPMKKKQKKNLKVLQIQIQKYTERIIHHDQVRYTPRIQDWFNIWKSM